MGTSKCGWKRKIGWSFFLQQVTYDPENQILKIEKNTWIYYHFTHLDHKWQSYDVYFLRYRVGQTEFFVILHHFWHFHPPNNLKNQNFEKMKYPPGDIIILHMCTINDNHDVWFLRSKFWKIEKKTPWGIIVLHKCTINDDHIMYRSWVMEWNGHNFLSFWTVFCHFTPQQPKKSKLKKNEKTPGDIIILE